MAVMYVINQQIDEAIRVLKEGLDSQVDEQSRITTIGNILILSDISDNPSNIDLLQSIIPQLQKQPISILCETVYQLMVK